MTSDMKLYAGLGVAALLVFFIVKNNAQEITAGVVAGAVDVVGDVSSGAVIGLGDALGVPRTNQTQCERDMAAGNKWDASFSCDAATFLQWLTGMDT